MVWACIYIPTSQFGFQNVDIVVGESTPGGDDEQISVRYLFVELRLLRAEVAELRAENAQLRADVAEIPALKARLSLAEKRLARCTCGAAQWDPDTDESEARGAAFMSSY